MKLYEIRLVGFQQLAYLRNVPIKRLFKYLRRLYMPIADADFHVVTCGKRDDRDAFADQI